ncbi:MAG: LamG-like jellyroll fold domain-containing protein [Parafilimonas sp.]
MAYYPFNGNANDASGNGNNPIFNNATLTSDYYGNANSAYHFNGVDNYMQIPNSANLNFSNTISICAWVKPTGFYTGTCYNNMLLSKQVADYVDGNYSLRFADAVTGCTGEANTNDEVFYGADGGIGNQSAVQLNQWYNVVFTSDGVTTKLYVNCKLVSSQPLTESSYTNEYDLFLGHLNDPTYPYWLNGDLDEVRIYNRALTEDEVHAYSDVCKVQPCSNWAKITSSVSGIQIGDLNVSGDKITVEATFNRTSPYSGSQLYAGDLVSKHSGPNDANYLLRPNSAEVTTTNGYFKTPDICDIQLNKTYHVAMVYDGKELKFYRNGFLMSEIACSGNLYQNNFLTAIGTFSENPNVTNENLIGYINEVRIWNVVRSQNDIKTYMNQPLPNPASEQGLLAYYTFDDLKNKQGNAQWNGSILGNASINQKNPECAFIADSCNKVVCNIKAGFTYQQNACDAKTIQFTDTTLNADSISWDFGNGKSETAHNPIIKYADYGQYIVHLYAKTTSGCKDTATDTINVSIKKDSAIITRDTSICAGSFLQLNSIKGLKYCWSPSKTLSDSSIQNPVATPTSTTIYYLNILVSDDQPVIQDSIIITIIPLPVVNAGGDVSICKGSSIQLKASGANRYNWNYSKYLSDTLIANPIATPDSTTNFIVNGYNVQGCLDRDTVKVSVLSLPVISIINDTAICIGGSIMLQANAAGNNSYSWSPSTALSSTNIKNPVANPTSSTKYFVTVTDSNSCVSLDSVNLNVLPLPTVSTLNDTSICTATSLILKTTSKNASIFNWTPSATLDSAATKSPEASPLTTTKYIVSAGNGICNEKDSVLVSLFPLPNVYAGNDTTVCGNNSAQLNASGAIAFTWDPIKALSDPNIANPVASPGSTTTYHVTGTDVNSCINIDSVTVFVQPPPSLGLSPNNVTICNKDSALLTASGGDSYSWSPVQTVLNPLSAATKVFPSINTTYKVVITNIACKVIDSFSASVNVKSLPAITVTKSNDVDCINFESQLMATGGISFTWTPDKFITNTQIDNPVVNPSSDTWYFVNVKGENGCKSQDSILVKSTINSDVAAFIVPNAFTPNHDGLNDCFSVKYWGPADYFDLAIYDRWGYLVYHSNNIKSCWDGTLNGKPQSSGTYVYKISVSSKCTNDVVVHKKGTVVLIR